jgi:UDP-N-acetylmuramoyl-tripeptide--D-alanyl-D-alanine ligase
MNTIWSSKEIIAATRGLSSGEWGITSVSIDTRTLEPGALFVALPGAHVDGHDYVKAALEKGAAAALVSRPVAGVDGEKLIMVKDVEAALTALARAARARSKAKFVGITGSVGKTGAKEMTAAALAPLGLVHATKGNLNNHLGVPLSLVNMPRDTEYAVIEMGMNHPGEITKLSHLVQPHVALITTVEAVHIEFFDSVEGIADEKSAIFDGMQGGVAILNADNAHFERCRAHGQARSLDRILSFGTGKSALCRMMTYAIDDTHSVIEASIAGTPIQYRIGTIGKHWALMSVAVLGMVDALRADVAKAAAALAHFTEPKGRGQIKKLSVKGGQLRLIDDAYNASPVSVKGAIAKLAEMRDASPAPVRTVVVLGDMLELGEHAEDMHVGLVPTLINNQMDLVFAAGSFMKKMYEALPEAMRGAYKPSSRELAPVVVEALRANDLVLVKGSRGSRMDIVADAIEGKR